MTERGFPGWGPLFAVIFALDSISSPLPFGPSSQAWFTWAKHWLFFVELRKGTQNTYCPQVHSEQWLRLF